MRWTDVERAYASGLLVGFALALTVVGVVSAWTVR